MADHGHLGSVNTGGVRTIEWNGRQWTTGIWKRPVDGRRLVQGVNVDGDDQADRSVHGGGDKAVYAYAAEDLAWWAEQLGREVGPGTFGENLTTTGLDLRQAVIGEVWEVGTAVLRVTQPRIPCFKLGIRMDDDRFPARFAVAGRPGAYLSIVEDGELGAGDRVSLRARPDHGVTVGDVERAYHDDRSLAPRLLDLPDRDRRAAPPDGRAGTAVDDAWAPGSRCPR
jgi:MOSC domain-containing protein YiiM